MFDKLKELLSETDQQRRPEAGLNDEQRTALQQLRSMAASMPDANGVISLGGYQRFARVASNNNIALRDFPDIRDPVLLGLALGGHFVAGETTLMLKGGESGLWDEPVELLKEVTDREFRGRSSGVSIPIGMGVRYRVGQSRGHMVTVGTHWDTADTGVLTVTDQRVVYHGTRKTLEFPYKKLATLQAFTDAVGLGVTSRQTTSTFRMRRAELVAGLIQAAADWSARGLTVVRR